MRFSIRSKALRGALCATALMAMLTACGGGNSNSSSSTINSPPAGNTQPEQIQGIATPSSVAVVTATNAD